jgi:hypothetical protein
MITHRLYFSLILASGFACTQPKSTRVAPKSVGVQADSNTTPAIQKAKPAGNTTPTTAFVKKTTLDVKVSAATGLPVEVDQYHYAVESQNTGVCINVKILHGVTDPAALKGIFKGECDRSALLEGVRVALIKECPYSEFIKDKRWESILLYAKGKRLIGGKMTDYVRDAALAEKQCALWDQGKDINE